MMFLVFLFCIHIYACCGDAYAQETNYLIHSPNDRPHHRRKHNMHRPPYKGYDWYSHYKMDTRPDLPKTTPPHDHTHGTTKGPLTDQEKLKQLQEMETKARLLKVHEWKSHLETAPMPGPEKTKEILSTIDGMAKNILEVRQIPIRRSKHHRRRHH
ncbi:uncharacterized protein LOC6596468 [Drosophila persimilis]|uniref:uncharacterized protein LOC6596468 n=1 Tax=Drosophila persimilis TaxID=7234 RepID=UPI000F0916AE|nr:uncharacterized protein LOC6596468 [Drosophila persimilis]